MSEARPGDHGKDHNNDDYEEHNHNNEEDDNEEKKEDEESEVNKAIDLLEKGGVKVASELRAQVAEMVTAGFKEVGKEVLQQIVGTVIPAPISTFIADAVGDLASQEDSVPQEMRDAVNYVNENVLQQSSEEEKDQEKKEEPNDESPPARGTVDDLRLAARIIGITTGIVVAVSAAPVTGVIAAIFGAVELANQLDLLPPSDDSEADEKSDDPNKKPPPHLRRAMVMTTASSATAAATEEVQPAVDTTDPGFNALKTLLKAWQKVPEEVWWQTFADFIRKNRYFTIHDHIVMLQTIMFMSPPIPVEWDSNADRWAIASILVTFYQQSSTTDIADIYLEVIKHRYQDAPLTRATAANLLVFALGKILLDAKTAGEPIKRGAVVSAVSHPKTTNDVVMSLFANTTSSIINVGDISHLLGLAQTLS